MAFCKNCGKEINEQETFCPNCGTALNSTQEPKSQPTVVDNGGIGWGLLGCCIPIVGLILFLVWKDSKPKTSKAAGIGALVGVILAVIYYIIAIAIGAASYLMY
jgi:uncharacterized membrane protein YvbJ